MKNTKVSPQLVTLLNNALENEHAIYIQYLSHAKTVKGVEARLVNKRLRRIAGYHRLHQKKLRHLIADYLDAVPSMKIGKTYSADSIDSILTTNMKCEGSTIDSYSKTLALLDKEQNNLPYEHNKIDYAIRKIIRRDQAHIAQLKKLQGT
jgi:bacterioferritin (cytochrome b1)